VSYAVRFDGAALVQLTGLPSIAFHELLEHSAVLMDEPWDAAMFAAPAMVRLAAR
jgi:hypothetical protein